MGPAAGGGWVDAVGAPVGDDAGAVSAFFLSLPDDAATAMTMISTTAPTIQGHFLRFFFSAGVAAADPGATFGAADGVGANGSAVGVSGSGAGSTGGAATTGSMLWTPSSLT